MPSKRWPAGRPVAVESTPAVGARPEVGVQESWSSRRELRQPRTEARVARTASVDQLKPSERMIGKLLLVNFWATWCEPCIAEFPELQKLVHMYRKRPFEEVTVSINSSDEKSGVLSFLQGQHAVTRNLLLDTTDPAEAIAAFDTAWSGGVPYTVLIGVDGKVLYKEQGAFNALEVRRAILVNLPDDHYIGTHAYWNSSF